MKTYSEQRQAIYFKAARELRAVAAEVLDDVTQDAELNGRTVEWAKSVAKVSAEKATELERLGWEECIAPGRAATAINKSHDAYHAAIDAFEARIKAARARMLTRQHGSDEAQAIARAAGDDG